MNTIPDNEQLRQLFKNESNCYADFDEDLIHVIPAMDEECFVHTVNDLLKKSYTEQEVINIVKSRENYLSNSPKNELYIPVEKWINEFKKS